MKQYLIQFKSGPNRGETVWARKDGGKYIRRSSVCIAIPGAEVEHDASEVTVLAVREYET